MRFSASRLATSIAICWRSVAPAPFFCSSGDIWASTKLWWSPPKRRNVIPFSLTSETLKPSRRV